MTLAKLPDEKKKLWLALGEYGRALADLPEPQVPDAYETANDLAKLADDIKDMLRVRIINAAKRDAAPSTKGTMTVTLGEKVVQCIVTRSGLDPKKLEGKLRSLKLDPNVHMDPTVTYKVNREKVDRLLADGQLNEGDIAACQYDRSYRISIKSDTQQPGGSDVEE